MNILLIKTSSLGDVIHTLPALTDAYQNFPELRCDWVVEENFSEIPSWHPAVHRVIPVAWRRWRKNLWQVGKDKVWQQFIQNLRVNNYDLVIDAQGLLKSAILTYLAPGLRCGLDYQSAREPLAALAYQQRHYIPKGQHAVTRVRQLFAKILGYSLPTTMPDYGIAKYFLPQRLEPLPRVILLHGTTWTTKHWPDLYWQALAQQIVTRGYQVRLPWGNAQEYARAQQIAAIDLKVSIISKTNLHGLAQELISATAVVGVDTGLAHLAAALGIPSITLYGATPPGLTGTYGLRQQHLVANFPCAPCLKRHCHYRGPAKVQPACYESISTAKVWEVLQPLLK